MTADSLFERGAVDRVIPEDGFSEEFFAKLKKDIYEFFMGRKKKSGEQLVGERYKRFRAF